ncbi:MAG: hypothetical protein ABJO72_00950 [Hyphomicrobiales bacterium]
MEKLMDATSVNIARYLSKRASKELRASYQMVADEIDWYHPTGRGLKNHLFEILLFCKEKNLPPLTTILVKKGTKSPPENALKYIHQELGNIDIEATQQEVFSYDWSGLFDELHLSSDNELSKEKSGIWLTSFWGWNPDKWGCLSFSKEWMRDKFIEQTEPGVLLAIYVSSSSYSDPSLAGRIVGFMEITHETGDLHQFIDKDSIASLQTDPQLKDKWRYSLRASKAWEIEQPYPFVQDTLPSFVNQARGRQIGARGMPVIDPDHIANLMRLPVRQVPVFNGEIADNEQPNQTLANIAKKVSRAIYPPKEPYFCAESDGPKYLYILRLSGDAGDWLSPHEKPQKEAQIYKVGFSKNPISRARQIQSAYPEGRFKWEILFPDPIPTVAMYPDAKTAIAGEDAMKEYLAKDKKRILGGEFFLATKEEITAAWQYGNEVANKFAANQNSSN